MFNLFFSDPVDLTQFNELKRLLDENEIPYETKKRFSGAQLVVPSFGAYKNEEFTAISAVCFPGTYGSEQGLIEVYAPQLNKGVEGHLNAKEAYEYIVDTRNGISRGSDG